MAYNNNIMLLLKSKIQKQSPWLCVTYGIFVSSFAWYGYLEYRRTHNVVITDTQTNYHSLKDVAQPSPSYLRQNSSLNENLAYPKSGSVLIHSNTSELSIPNNTNDQLDRDLRKSLKNTQPAKIKNPNATHKKSPATTNQTELKSKHSEQQSIKHSSTAKTAEQKLDDLIRNYVSIQRKFSLKSNLA